MTSADERMSVNASIENLIRGYDEDSARIVIAYGSKIRNSRDTSYQGTARPRDSRNGITGYSPGHGKVTVNNSEDKDKNPSELTLGIYKDRVGHYRLWRVCDNILVFQHFWKSNLSTQSENSNTPQQYVLAYDMDSLSPTCFGLYHKVIVLQFSLFGVSFEIYRNYVECLYGKTTFRGRGISYRY